MKKYTLFVGIAVLLAMVSCEKESEIVPEIEYEEDAENNPKKDRWYTRPPLISVDSTANG